MAFGGTETDHFGLATTDLILIESTKTPVNEARADALDENGDICAASWFGNDAGTLFDASCTYLLKSGTLNLNTLDLGEISAGTIVESIDAATSNGDWPKVTVSGKLGAQTVTSPTGFENTFALPSITLTGAKFAQTLGFDVDEGKLTSCTFGASADVAQANDADGEPVGHGVAGAVGTVSAELVNVGTAPAWTLTLVGLTETQAPSSNDPQAAYSTSSASAEIIITRTATV